MPLDLGEITLQLEQRAQSLGQTKAGRDQRLQALLETANHVDPATVRDSTESALDRPYLAAVAEEGLLGSQAPPPAPDDWQVAAVDGSHIDVDRHLPVACFLINLGGCVLTYGANPNADFFSRSQLATEPSDLSIADPGNTSQEEQISGQLLGLMRTVGELERLAQVVSDLPPELPTLALVDGSLVLWGLSGQGYKPFVRDAIIRDRLLPAMEKLREMAQTRSVALAAYVSLPRSTEVVNAVRCCICPHDINHCRQSCGSRRSTATTCDIANEFLDRDLFQSLLPSGWRSPVYRTNSSVPREHYGKEQQVYFYYLQSEEEIGRVEIPAWVALDEKLLGLSHSLILDQCQRGQGYPVAISESHEQAVIHTSDRRVFKQMVSEALERQGLFSYTSEKDRSKRSPWV